MPQNNMTLERVVTSGEPNPSHTFASLRQSLIPYYEREPTRAQLHEVFETLSGRVALREADVFIRKLFALREAATSHVARLTVREHQIMELILLGEPNKIIAADLGISQRTVENHRASIMKKTGAKSLPALARLALLASWIDGLGLKS
jgi:two-component system CheB/CheR fusion protein